LGNSSGIADRMDRDRRVVRRRLRALIKAITPTSSP